MKNQMTISDGPKQKDEPWKQFEVQSPHERAQMALLVTPTIGFTALHGVDRELILTRQACTMETARNWVAQITEALGERVIWTEVEELKP